MKYSLFSGGCSFKDTTYLLRLKFAENYLAKKWPVYPVQCSSAPDSEKHVHTRNEKIVELKRQSASWATVLADLTVISPPLTKKINSSLSSEDFQQKLWVFVGLIPTYADLVAFKIVKLLGHERSSVIKGISKQILSFDCKKEETGNLCFQLL